MQIEETNQRLIELERRFKRLMNISDDLDFIIREKYPNFKSDNLSNFD
tara:strand:+ start:30 stop:173 length:144 start_codon:yes stop_codon:yes gene_type:complete